LWGCLTKSGGRTECYQHAARPHDAANAPTVWETDDSRFVCIDGRVNITALACAVVAWPDHSSNCAIELGNEGLKVRDAR